MRFACEGETPFAEFRFEGFFFQSSEIADFANAYFVEILFHYFAYARDFAYFEGREEPGFYSGKDVQDAVGLGLIGRDLGNQS